MAHGSGRARLDCLAVEPWLGGSHERFLDQWRRRSRHAVELAGLPARAWKWRMRAGAWELARELAGRAAPDVLLVSDFLDLPAFLGFLPSAWSAVPVALYLHENQLVYPARPGAEERERDAHYGFTNLLSVARADRVVFNSAFHRDAFAAAARELCARLPRPNPLREVERAIERSLVVAPGIELEEVPLGPGGPPGAPLRVAFPHRWEHDKDPRAFLEAAARAIRAGASLELVLLGERFEEPPEGVAPLLDLLRPHVVHDGCAATREEYARLLGGCDLAASTARHEFFGLAAGEALAAGCAPLFPRRLAYPELLTDELREDGLYGEDGELGERLARAAADPARYRVAEFRARCRRAAERFDAERTARELDALCEELAGGADSIEA